MVRERGKGVQGSSTRGERGIALTGRQLRPKTDRGTIEKYVVGGENEWKNGLEKILREIGEWRRETREQLMEERKKKEEWRAQKKAIEKRLVDLEWKNEKTERQNRKNNIIIKGLKEEHEMVEQDIEKYIEEILKIEVRIKKVSENERKK